MSDVVILGCGIYRKEIRYLITKNNWDIDAFFLTSAFHSCPEKILESLNDKLDMFKEQKIVIFYGACHPKIDEKISKSNAVRIENINCVSAILGEKEYNTQIKNGAYFISDDWLPNWKSVFKEIFGNHKEGIKAIFQDSHKFIGVIHTPFSKYNENDIKEFSEYVGLPLKVIDCNLNYLEKTLIDKLSLYGEFKIQDNILINEEDLNEYRSRIKRLASKKARIEQTRDCFKSLSTTNSTEETCKKLITEVINNFGAEELEIYIANENNYQFFNSHESNPLIENIKDNSILEFINSNVQQRITVGQDYLLYKLTFLEEVIGIAKIIGSDFCDKSFYEDVISLLEYTAIRIKHFKELGTKLRDIEAFNYTVAHDLKSPLRAISGFSKIILEDLNPNDEIKNYLVKIDNASQKLSHLIDAILNLSKIDSYMIRKTEFDLLPVIDTIVSNNLETYKKQTVQLPSNKKITTDQSLLEIVLNNIIGNAFKYTVNQNSPFIKIDIKDELFTIKLIISDNGIGISKENIPHLYKPFTRFTSAFQGNGIGLSIASRIIKKLNGKIFCESELNSGCTFTIELPK